MSHQDFRMVDLNSARARVPHIWPALRVPADTIAREIEKLADAPRPSDGRRASTIVHPDSCEPGLGFAPGVDVAINVLKPGESTTPSRRNSNQVEFCIAGSGTVVAGSTSMHLGKWDVCTLPSMQPYTHRNDGNELWVRLSYSNAPLLEKLGIHYIEETDVQPEHTGSNGGTRPDVASERYTRSNAPDFPVGTQGARMRGYEFLTDIEVVPSVALHWPWHEITQHVSRRAGDGKRGIMLLYNPATERRNGTTHSFFATISSTPAGAPPRPIGRGHRHGSVAINYHFEGAGRSTVDGKVIEWRAGDLLLSAPAWSEHAHFIHPEGASVLTIQDHPLHIGMESLIWQERMDGPILTLGSENGQTGYVGPRIAGA